MAAELMTAITHLSALYPGAFLLELRAKQPNGELHYEEHFSHMVLVVQRALGQDSLNPCDKSLSGCHKAKDKEINHLGFFSLKDIFLCLFSAALTSRRCSPSSFSAVIPSETVKQLFLITETTLSRPARNCEEKAS